MDPPPRYGAYKILPYLDSRATQQSAASQRLHIKTTSTWTYSGPLLTTSTLPSSFHSWSAHLTSSPSALLSRFDPLLCFLEHFLSEAGVHHYWLTLRATQPTSEYDVPRWHVDEDFFAESQGPGSPSLSSMPSAKRPELAGWKLCTTLLGPGTLFLRSASNAAAIKNLRLTKTAESEKRKSHTCTSIRCAGCFDTSASVRRALAVSLAGEELVQPAYGELALFRIGDHDGAVHSEPRCDVDRLFVNVVPGTEQDLRILMKRYGMGFPRAWCLGVPGSAVRADELGNVKGP